MYLQMISTKIFFSVIWILESEFNKIAKQMDYFCKNYIFRRILILLMNVRNLYDVCYMRCEDMILSPHSCFCFSVLSSNNRVNLMKNFQLHLIKTLFFWVLVLRLLSIFLLKLIQSYIEWKIMSFLDIVGVW